MQYQYKKFLTILFLIPVFLTGASAADWYDRDWDYRKNITFNQSQISGSNEDFPALINITDNDLKEKAQNDGDDILFTSSNGTFKLDHEIENYDNSTGKLTAHVKVLNMTNKTQTSIFMYYGNSEASNQENATGVWSNGYEGVYHLDEEQSGTGNSAVYKDATSNDRDGDDEVSAIGQDGQILDGQEFDGSDDYIGDFTEEIGVGDLTIEAWAKVNSGNGGAVTGSYDGYPQVKLRIHNGDIGGGRTVGAVRLRLHDGSDLVDPDSTTTVDDGNYHYLAGIREGDTASIYVDGAEEGTKTDSNLDNNIQNTNRRIGSRPDGNEYFQGNIDEVRLSSISRSNKWISTTYNSQKNSGSFYSVGEEEKSSRSSEYVHTFLNGTDKPRSFFGNNSNVTIRTTGSFSSNPNITVTDSDGVKRISSATMTNISNTYEYNYTLDGVSGWYDVKINDEKWENVFYQGEKWQGNFTDADGNKYTFRRKVNVSESDVSDRFFEPIDVNVDFGFSPDNDSIRMVAWNGSRMLEIPSQVYNVTKSGESVSNANIVFLSTLNKSEKRNYYVVSSKSEYKKNYKGLNNTDNALDEKVQNSRYKAFFNQSLGYLMKDVKNKIGSSESLSGLDPMDRYPQVDVPSGLETDTKKARIDSTAEINVTEGPLLTEISVEGDLDGQTDYPYSVDCSIYAASPYMVCEKNLSTQVSEDWQNLYFNGLVFEDGKFGWTAYRNSTGDISTQSIGSGDNSDYSNLDSDMTWVTFFDNSTGDAVGEIVLQRNFSITQNTNFKIKDDSDNDFYQNILIGDTSVNAGDYWYTKTARMIYNGLRGSSYVNETYNQLDDPVTAVKGEEVTDDKNVPNYSNAGNVSTNDSSSVKVHSYWVDDTFLDYAEINITGNGVNGSNTELYFNDSYDIRDSGDFTNTSWVNVTLENSTVNAGLISANITVFDVAGKSNSTLIEFNVSDTTAPEYGSVVNEPNSSADLDPDQSINVTANITEYSNVSTAFLYYKNDSIGNYSKVKMDRNGETDFVHTYEANFTPAFEDNYTYYVSTNDTLDQRKNSSKTNLTIAWDYTWNFNPNLNGATDTFNKNLSIGNFTINNTGDFNQSFKLATGVFNSRTWVNRTVLPATFEIENSSSDFFVLNATTRDSTSTEGVDTFNLTVENSSSTPDLNFSSFDVTTSTGGPFLFTEITEYNSTVTQGDTGVKLTAETTNKGNESASTVNITFKLPSDWSVSDGGSLTSSNSISLDVGTSKTFTTKVDVASDASTGTKTLEAVAKSQEDNRSTTVDLTVESKSSGGNNNDNSGSGGGGSGGGGGGSSGGSGGTSLTSEQQQKLFQTEQTYELVRGQDQEFMLTVENPFDKGELEGVSVNVTGFLSQYLSVEPARLEAIPVNESRNFTIHIEAPKYFSRGEYSLNFNITGVNNQTEKRPAGNKTILVGNVQEFKENREVKLVIHEISREKATDALNRSRNAVEELNKQDFLNAETQELLEQAEEALNTGNYQKARQISQQIQANRQQAETARKTIQEVENLIEDAEYRGLDAPRTERMTSMSTAALERGDYGMAANRAEEAKNLYALETKGEINYLNLMQRKWEQVTIAMVILAFTSISGFYRLRLFRIKRKLSKLENEEETLLGLMKQVQRESFEEGKMSMEEYEEAMMQYEKQLSQNVKDTVRLESRKAHWLNIRKGRERYEHERDRIQDLMQETQEKYLDEGSIETRVYKQKMQSFRERLTELEGKLAEMEAQKQIDKETGYKGYLKNPLEKVSKIA